jgi:hypothetical protein
MNDSAKRNGLHTLEYLQDLLAIAPKQTNNNFPDLSWVARQLVNSKNSNNFIAQFASASAFQAIQTLFLMQEPSAQKGYAQANWAQAQTPSDIKQPLEPYRKAIENRLGKPVWVNNIPMPSAHTLWSKLQACHSLHEPLAYALYGEHHCMPLLLEPITRRVMVVDNGKICYFYSSVELQVFLDKLQKITAWQAMLFGLKPSVVGLNFGEKPKTSFLVPMLWVDKLKCTECDHIAQSEDDLIVHRRVHVGEKQNSTTPPPACRDKKSNRPSPLLGLDKIQGQLPKLTTRGEPDWGQASSGNMHSLFQQPVVTLCHCPCHLDIDIDIACACDDQSPACDAARSLMLDTGLFNSDTLFCPTCCSLEEEICSCPP